MIATLILSRHGADPVTSPQRVEMEKRGNQLVNTSEVKWDSAEVPSEVNWEESTVRLTTEAGRIVGTLTLNRAWGFALVQECADYLGLPVTGLEAAPGSLTLELVAP